MRRIGSVTILLLALLAGCAFVPVEQRAGTAYDRFELTGRVAVRYGSEGATGRIEWQHSQADDEMLITSTLGQGIARITRRDGAVTLVTADRREYSASDAESLTERVLGWRLPLGGLPDWVQGRADPAYPARVRRDERSRISELTQDDWRVEYQEYDGARPSRLRITRADLEIRLVVDEWVATR